MRSWPASVSTPSPVGFSTISTPPMPTPIATQRRHSTCSPRIGTDSAVISNGATKKMLYASASGSRFNA